MVAEQSLQVTTLVPSTQCGAVHRGRSSWRFHRRWPDMKDAVEPCSMVYALINVHDGWSLVV